ncbi:MAG: polysaccharide deacetylase family protein [archaeon]|nr:polysaccharide deacetylase family protein [archaeon]MCP8313017.1 polysaccharide deacetylase family protein [archaeon]MCP8316423.1 polysaccharide deacetylase family protein [archaeon]MCP8321093.1 polysaccharide deacetylase family protein [archaeon]
MPSVQVLITFDFEEWEVKADLYAKTKRIVNLLMERGLPATFFLDADTVLKYPEAARLLLDGQFELALHSDYHFTKNNSSSHDLDFSLQSHETQILRLMKAIEMIRKVIPSFDPKGFRAPGLRWNDELYISLSKLNFLYDSSQQDRFTFKPFLKNGIIVFPVNCGEHDSACYKQKPQYVINDWIDKFKSVYRATNEGVKPYFLVLAHPSVSGKYKYIGMLKAILNRISYYDVEYLTCSEAAHRYLRERKLELLQS